VASSFGRAGAKKNGGILGTNFFDKLFNEQNNFTLHVFS
jgi:hypothetical protein